MASGLGRRARIAAGFAIIAVGLVGVGGGAGIAIAAVGLVPLIAGYAALVGVRASLGTLRDPDSVVPDQIAGRIQSALAAPIDRG